MGAQAAMVGELFVLAEKSQKDSKKPSGQGRFLQWYFFLVAAFWMYFRSLPSPSPSLTACMVCNILLRPLSALSEVPTHFLSSAAFACYFQRCRGGSCEWNHISMPQLQMQVPAETLEGLNNRCVPN